jgi:hypothetical protein
MSIRMALACIACALLGACSLQQLYTAGQQWQRNRCQKIDDRAERTRCEQDVAMSFENYKAQAEPSAKR